MLAYDHNKDLMQFVVSKYFEIRMHADTQRQASLSSQWEYCGQKIFLQINKMPETEILFFSISLSLIFFFK